MNGSDGCDPCTGRPIAGDELSELIKAAGGNPVLPVAQDFSGALCIQLLAEGGEETLQQFFTSSAHEAQSRICAFFEAVSTPSMHVKIEFGCLRAIAFRLSHDCVQTSWMDRSVMQSNPAVIYYPATQFSAWAYNISTCFLNCMTINNNVHKLKEVASRRVEASMVPDTPPTPPGPWLEAQAPSVIPSAVHGFA